MLGYPKKDLGMTSGTEGAVCQRVNFFLWSLGNRERFVENTLTLYSVIGLHEVFDKIVV